jgi:hypothetical protein
MANSSLVRDRARRFLPRCPAALLPIIVIASCARIEPPPGGPPDVDAPRLIAISPDSLKSFADYDEPVEFVFDEVISEGGGGQRGGQSELARLVLLSPTTTDPEVDWKRTRITVEPADGWKPNRVYRAQLLPGVTDLRRNRSDEGAVVTFTTGAPLPRATLTGQVVDWSSGRPAVAALVEALLLPDSLPYRAIADSSGRFSLGPLPEGEYLVSGVVDQNQNRRADGREAFDTVRLARGKTGAGELWAFVHDTAPPRASTVTAGDSVSAIVELSQPLNPRLKLGPKNATVLALPDSSPVAVVSVLPKPLDDSLHARQAARPDTAAADTVAGDTATRGARRPPPTEPSARLTSRPPLSNQVVVRVRQPWKPGGRYAVEIRGVRNVSGTTGDVRGTLVVAEPAARDTLAPADSVPAEPE